MVHNGNPVLSGPFAGLSIKFNFSTGKSARAACYADLDNSGDIYPLFQQVYRITPVAIAQITNGESAEIRNVTVSFRAGKYTSSALKSEVVPVIKRMKTFDIPLYVDFSSELLKFSENGMLSGEVVIEYELLGKKKHLFRQFHFLFPTETPMSGDTANLWQHSSHRIHRKFLSMQKCWRSRKKLSEYWYEPKHPVCCFYV